MAAHGGGENPVRGKDNKGQHGAAAGLHLMITFEADFSDADLAAAALAQGVKAQPLSWHCQCRHRPGLIMGYAANPPAEIAEGIRILGQVVRSH